MFSLLRNEYGYGTYYLKLLDEDGNMTGYNFSVDIDDPDDMETLDRLESLRNRKAMTRLFKEFSH